MSEQPSKPPPEESKSQRYCQSHKKAKNSRKKLRRKENKQRNQDKRNKSALYSQGQSRQRHVVTREDKEDPESEIFWTHWSGKSGYRWCSIWNHIREGTPFHAEQVENAGSLLAARSDLAMFRQELKHLFQQPPSRPKGLQASAPLEVPKFSETIARELLLSIWGCPRQLELVSSRYCRFLALFHTLRCLFIEREKREDFLKTRSVYRNKIFKPNGAEMQQECFRANGYSD